MRPAHVPLAEVHAVLRSLQESRRLAGVVRKMAREIERLAEDNAQLHAALKVYREVLRQHETATHSPAFQMADARRA